MPGLRLNGIKTIQLNEDNAKKIFDIAINSMDFGSGFLDDKEVTVLREFAVMLGLNPMIATPDTFRSKYLPEHEHEFVVKKFWDIKTKKMIEASELQCQWCRERKPIDD